MTETVPTTWCPPPRLPRRAPVRALPAGACDAHSHVFGPYDRFPLPPDSPFRPPEAGGETLLALHRVLGVDRGVVVQSAAHGHDHRALLAALALGDGRYRGVALLRPGMPDAELQALAEAGVCGARVHFVPHLGAPPDAAGQRWVRDAVRALGWHLEVHVSGSAIVDHARTIARLGVPVVVDHMARIDPADGPAGASLTALLSLLDTGHVWVKVSGVDRVSRTGSPWADGISLARRLVEHAPGRVLWGTDFPHVNVVGEAPGTAELVDALDGIAVSGVLRRRLLVENPAEFFGFDLDSSFDVDSRADSLPPHPVDPVSDG